MPVSFFSRTTATNVWKSVTGVSSAGSRRGRGKGTGRAIVKDFNRGQQIGEGRYKLVLPGLNTKISSRDPLSSVHDAGPNPEFHEKISQVRKEMDIHRKRRDMPIERGWSGRRAGGRSSGQPSDYNEASFEDFNSTILMLRPIPVMSGILGRTRIMQALVCVGNGNGTAGFAVSSGKDGRAVVRHARNVATQYLVYAPRWENHTVLHDFHSRYYQSTVFVERKSYGYGLNCHRVVKEICKLIGIRDLYARVEGRDDNEINITKAFFLGLMNQKAYQDIAEEKRLHLVDIREENFNYPKILASPKESEILREDQIKAKGEDLDFTYYINEGRINGVKYEHKPHYMGSEGWKKHLDRVDQFKNREKMKLELAAKYGNALVKDVFPYFKTNAKAFTKESPVD